MTAAGTPDADAILKELKNIDSSFQEVAAFSKNSSQAILTRHLDHIVAAFRGTDELGDWWDNLNALPTDGPFGSVHKGFQNAMMDVWPEMRAKLRQFVRIPENTCLFGSQAIAWEVPWPL